MSTRDRSVFAARLDSTPQIRGFVERACARAGIADEECFALKLAVDEASTNVIQHGYGPGVAGAIEVEFEADDDEVRVAITDTGRPFNPLEYPPPDLDKGDDRPIGGLGIHLMRSSVDEVHYRPDPAGNRLELVKKLQGRAHARPGRE